MFWISLILACTAVLFVSGETTQTTLEPPSNRSSIRITSSECSSGQCQCNVAAPPVCDLDPDYIQLNRVRRQLDGYFVRLNGASVDSLKENSTSLLSKMSELESSLQSQSISWSMSQLAFIRAQVANLQAAVTEVKAARTQPALLQIQSELNTTINALSSLRARNPLSVREDAEEEMTRLRENCVPSKVMAILDDSSVLRGNNLPFNATLSKDHCPASYNLTLGEPRTYKFRPNINGMWLKDPLPTHESVKGRIFEINNPWANSIYMYSWDNLAKYEAFNSDSLKTQSPCAFHHFGTKSLLLNGQLIWYDANAKLVRKQSVLDSAQCGATFVVNMKFQITDSADNSYMGNTQTKADINFDETGLYVTYGDADGELVVAKLNPATMEVERSWETGRKKLSIANMFMVCGRVYTTDSFSARHLSGAQWGFDTLTGEEFLFKFDIGSKYGNLKELSYNPRERVIFGWDNQHAVVYPVYF